jgi:hypothetical protein
MKEISVKVCGDHWLNVDEVQFFLAQNKHEQLVINLNSEGPCLIALGIQQAIIDQGIDPKQVTIVNWPNAVNSTKFIQEPKPLLSHFFWMSQNYWPQLSNFVSGPRLAFFIGRRTVARATMMYDIHTTWPDSFLTSVMSPGVDDVWTRPPPGMVLETLDDWIALDHQFQFKQWWKHCPINSIDNHTVRDQYDIGQNTNRDLLQHYHKFGIELTAESYTFGDTFFVTEKTIRPLAAGKPMLIYGPCNFISGLQRLGFETWGDLWSEEYDNYQGATRWQSLKKTIEYIVSRTPDEWDIIWQQAQSRAVRNRIKLLTLIEKYQPI